MRVTYGLAAEPNALLRIEDRPLPHERLDATGTTVDLVESDLANDFAAVLSGGEVSMGAAGSAHV